jgi:hypothetical protein
MINVQEFEFTGMPPQPVLGSFIQLSPSGYTIPDKVQGYEMLPPPSTHKTSQSQVSMAKALAKNKTIKKNVK